MLNITRLLMKTVSLAFFTLMCMNSVNAQEITCDSVPSGLIGVTSMQWVSDTVVQVTVGSNLESKYLQTLLKWDLVTTNLKAIPFPEVANALSMIDALGYEGSFFDQTQPDQVNLEVSPAGDSAILLRQGELTLYDSVDNDETTLGKIPITQINDVYWVNENEIIIVGQSIYGEGYDVAHICTDQICFEQLSQNTGDTFWGNPGVNISEKTIAFYDMFNANLSIFDWGTSSITQQIHLEFNLIPNLKPIWSEDGKSVYVLGLSRNSDFELYQITIDTAEVKNVARLSSEMSAITPNTWLFSEAHNLVLIASALGDRRIFIQCF
jgi:hypothetical protein